MKLLIVESPNKIKKLKAILGADFEVAASVGHIRDLPLKELGIDRSASYKMTYHLNVDKQKVVDNLKYLVNKIGAQNVLLATDPDREGEAIAAHLAQVLNIPFNQAKRVTFQELTQRAIQNALGQIRNLDVRLIAAQEARRAIDRLVGYEVSPLLWRKIGGKLSAGRVQSVALRLVVDRERTIQDFAESFSYKALAEFRLTSGEIIKATRVESFTSELQVLNYLSVAEGKQFTVSSIDEKPLTVTPPPPFITSTLQQEAIKKLSRKADKWNAKRVMDVAQKLFEGGHITYMRTDSPNLSQEAIDSVSSHILNQYGKDYLNVRRFKAKQTAQEAHEAIRPTHFDQLHAGDDEAQQQLYRLIFLRSLASQMAPARYRQTIISIAESDPNDIYQAKAKVLEFDGFQRIYQESSLEEIEEDDSSMNQSLTSLINIGERVKQLLIQIKQTYSMPPRRFDEPTLVKALESKGIGRPSTYAAILSNITNRQYVELTSVKGRQLTASIYTWQPDTKVLRSKETVSIGGDKDKFVPTAIGLEITAFLEKYFDRMIDYEFTSQVERQLDEILEGKQKFIDVVAGFDADHRQQIQRASQEAADITPSEPNTILLGKKDSFDVRAGKSKYGTYISWNGEFYSIKNKEPHELNLDDLELAITQKQERDNHKNENLIAKVGKTYEIRRGLYGIYVTDGTTKAPIRNKSEEELSTITEKDCQEIIKGYLNWKKSKNSKK